MPLAASCCSAAPAPSAWPVFSAVASGRSPPRR
ncbi:MYXO-CTERM sorting domain-containing protein [Serratia ureilytica]